MFRIALLLGCLTAMAPGAAVAEDAPSQTQILRWIEELNSESYIVRERATENLARCGKEAIAPLAAAAEADDAEKASRAVLILWKLAQDERDIGGHGDPLAALERIAALNNRPLESATAKSILRSRRQRHALSEIKVLGGEVLEPMPYWINNQLHVPRLRLGEDWEGTDEDLRHLRDIQNVQVLEIWSAPISDDAIAHLKQLQSLQSLHLFGTDISEKGVASLKLALPQAEIDYRQGALLGVAGIDHPRGAQITRVQPGTAAAEVDLQAGDVIVKFNGQPVEGMRDLTDKIRVYRPGDQAKIEWIRAAVGGQSYSREVTFSSWR